VAVKILAAVGSDEEQNESIQAVERHLTESVKGDSVSFDNENLHEYTDLSKIQKYYKTQSEQKTEPPKQPVNGAESKSVKCSELEGLLLGMMAIKGS
jgi:Kinase binding protein CGI-121